MTATLTFGQFARSFLPSTVQLGHGFTCSKSNPQSIWSTRGRRRRWNGITRWYIFIGQRFMTLRHGSVETGSQNCKLRLLGPKANSSLLPFVLKMRTKVTTLDTRPKLKTHLPQLLSFNRVKFKSLNASTQERKNILTKFTQTDTQTQVNARKKQTKIQIPTCNWSCLFLYQIKYQFTPRAATSSF